jgi:hypothetical protein
MPKTCFVIGPIGEPVSKIRDEADDLMKYIIASCPALKEFDYAVPVRADQLNEPGRITSQVIKLLVQADLVISDLTNNNANVYYELSLRHALGKPAIHMAQEGTLLSFDLRDNRTIFYTMHSRSAEAARGELTNQIRRIHTAGYKVTNPVVETAGIIQLEQSADPNQSAMGRLMSMVADIGGEVKSLQAAVREVQIKQAANNALTYPGGRYGPTGPTGTLGDNLLSRYGGLAELGRGALSGTPELQVVEPVPVETGVQSAIGPDGKSPSTEKS